MASTNTRSSLCNSIKEQIDIVDLAYELGYTPVRISRNFYSLREHDSMRISVPERLWYQNSVGKGGSVIDFEMEFGNRRYSDGYDERNKLRTAGYWAARGLSERFGMAYRYTEKSQPKSTYKPKRTYKPKDDNVRYDKNNLKALEYLPDKSGLAYDYLTVKRGIDSSIVNDFIQKGIVRVGIDRQVPQSGQVMKCVFYSPENNYGIMRVMDDSKIDRKYRVMDLQGSDQENGFFIDYDPSNKGNKTLVVTESVIDAMSVMTELKRQGEDLSNYKFLATAGTGKAKRIVSYQMRKRDEATNYTGRLTTGDRVNGNVSRILLAFDNDEAGRKALDEVREVITDESRDNGFVGEIIDYLPPSGKDWNEFVQLPVSERDAIYNGKEESLHRANISQNEQTNTADVIVDDEIDDEESIGAISAVVNNEIGYDLEDTVYDETELSRVASDLRNNIQSINENNQLDRLERAVAIANLEDRAAQLADTVEYGIVYPEEIAEMEVDISDTSLRTEIENNNGITASEYSNESVVNARGAMILSSRDGKDTEYYVFNEDVKPSYISSTIQNSYQRDNITSSIKSMTLVTETEYNDFVNSNNVAFIVKANLNGNINFSESSYSITEINNGRGGLRTDERVSGINVVTTYRDTFVNNDVRKTLTNGIYKGDTILYNGHKMEVKAIEDDYITLYDKEPPKVENGEVLDRLVDVDIDDTSKFVVMERGIEYYTVKKEQYDARVEMYHDKLEEYYDIVGNAHPEIQMPLDTEGTNYERALQDYRTQLRQANTDPSVVFPERDFGSPPSKPKEYVYDVNRAGLVNIEGINIDGEEERTDYVLNEGITSDDVIDILKRNRGNYTAITSSLSLIASKVTEEDYGAFYESDKLTFEIKTDLTNGKYDLRIINNGEGGIGFRGHNELNGTSRIIGENVRYTKDNDLSFSDDLTAKSLLEHDVIFYNNQYQEVINTSEEGITLIDLDAENRGESIVTNINGDGWEFELDGNGFAIIERATERDPEKIVDRTPVISDKTTSNPLNMTKDGFMIRDGLLVEYRGDETTVIIPNGVTEIETGAFTNSNVEHVDIPNSVTTIRDYAFSECRYLQDITIPNSVTTIGNGAFYRSGLRNIIIPESVQNIGNEAFASSNHLHSVTIDARLSKIPNGMFADCFRMNEISIPDSVESIGSHAFSRTGLIDIEIPSSVMSIGKYAFYGSELADITLPNTNISIGKNAFKDTEVEEIVNSQISDETHKQVFDTQVDKNDIQQSVGNTSLITNDDIDPSRPYIKCEWSESYFFEDNTNYSVLAFEALMSKANSLHIAERDLAIEMYGSIQNAIEARDKGEYDGRGIGYDKTKFTVVYPDGRTYTSRQDIGDYTGGVLKFLSEQEHYDITELVDDIKLDRPVSLLDDVQIEAQKEPILTDDELQALTEEADKITNVRYDNRSDVFDTNLDKGVRSLIDPDSYKKFLKNQMKAPYSNMGFDNSLRVFAVRPDATYMLGYHKWQEVGRQVNKGAKGIPIVSVSFLARREEKVGKANMIIQALKDQERMGVAEPKMEWGKMVLTLNTANGEISSTLNGNPYKTFAKADDFRAFVEKRVNSRIEPTEKLFVFDINDTSVSKNIWVRKDSGDYRADEVIYNKNGKPYTSTVKTDDGRTETYIMIKNSAERQSRGIPSEIVDVQIDDKKAENLLGVLTQYADERNIILPDFNTSDTSVNKCAEVIVEIAKQKYNAIDLETISNEDMSLDERISTIHTAIKADTMAYCIGQRYGIEIDTPSFKYMPTFARDFDVTYFKNTLETAFRETLSITNELTHVLERNGLNLDLTPKPTIMLSAENVQSLSSAYMQSAISGREKAQSGLNGLPVLASQFANVSEARNLLTQQYNSFRNELASVNNIYDGISDLNNAESRSEQENALLSLSSSRSVIIDSQRADNSYARDFISITENMKAKIRSDYEKNPLATLKNMANDYPALASLSEVQLKYIASSSYINTTFSRFLSTNPDMFVRKAVERASELEKISSKNGVFVEIRKCENLYTPNPFFSSGTLCSTAVANKVIAECETQSRAIIAKAENEQIYIPPARCEYTIFVPDGDTLKTFTSSLDIGDGTQKDFKDSVTQWCNTDFKNKILSSFDEPAYAKNMYEPTRSASTQTKMPSLQNSNPPSDYSDETEEYDNRSLSEMAAEAREGSEAMKKAAREENGKNSQSRRTAPKAQTQAKS